MLSPLNNKYPEGRKMKKNKKTLHQSQNKQSSFLMNVVETGSKELRFNVMCGGVSRGSFDEMRVVERLMAEEALCHKIN